MSKIKSDILTTEVQHIDIKKHDFSRFIEEMHLTALQSRNTARAAKIYERMLTDNSCSVILCLSGSLISAGLKKIIVDMIELNMVDALVSTGANIVDQDFFEAIGFKHYQGSPLLDDEHLQELAIDRIYDTIINEDQLRICDDTIFQIANHMEPRPYSSREFIIEMGRFLEKNHSKSESIVLSAYRKKIPIFVPAFSDCSAGMGLIMHQIQHPNKHITIDSIKDFRELTELKIKASDTGLFILGGGAPKSFAQNIVTAAQLIGHNVPLHKYAIQITVADERDGGISGSTLREASSWGKVATVHEQMVYSEATLSFPIIVGYVYSKNIWQSRKAKKYNELFTSHPVTG